ncbi:MAG: biotin/lipoyl-containing protein [Peptoanaerobacter stomatis]|uniref:biotin/lipoyl-containing protein n=1 Tax=Peptoanaerobacter stomatis TaxID=796937 RepID=UPI003FA027C2
MRYVVRINGKEYDVEVEKLGGPYQSLTRGTAYMQAPVAYAPVPAPAPAPVAPAPTPAPVASAGSASDVTSPMPGKVFKVLAKPGDTVSEGQAVMILEAMKMENEIVAPVAGVIDAILVKEGDMVETDDVLAKLK